MVLAILAGQLSDVMTAQSRRRSIWRLVCMHVLKQTDGAVKRWAVEHNKAATDTYSLTDPVLLS